MAARQGVASELVVERGGLYIPEDGLARANDRPQNHVTAPEI